MELALLLSILLNAALAILLFFTREQDAKERESLLATAAKERERLLEGERQERRELASRIQAPEATAMFAIEEAEGLAGTRFDDDADFNKAMEMAALASREEGIDG